MNIDFLFLFYFKGGYYFHHVNAIHIRVIPNKFILGCKVVNACSSSLLVSREVVNLVSGDLA